MALNQTYCAKSEPFFRASSNSLENVILIANQ